MPACDTSFENYFADILPLLFVCKFLCFLAKQKVYDFKRRVPIKKRLFVLSFCRSTLCRWQILCLLCVSMMCFQVFPPCKTKFLPFFLFSKGQYRFCLHAIRLLKVTFADFLPLLFSFFVKTVYLFNTLREILGQHQKCVGCNLLTYCNFLL